VGGAAVWGRSPALGRAFAVCEFNSSAARALLLAAACACAAAAALYPFFQTSAEWKRGITALWAEITSSAERGAVGREHV
jgi:hypothetical protein